MLRTLVILSLTVLSAKATTLWPELKAYDFARAYYIEDGGIVIVPQDGFYCPRRRKNTRGLASDANADIHSSSIRHE